MNSKSHPKTLLLVGSKPGAGTVGEILIREMLNCVDPQRYVIAAMLRTDEAQDTGGTVSPRMKTFLAPREAEGVAFGRFTRLRNAGRRLIFYERDIAALTREVEVFAKQEGIQRVWAILNMTSVIDVADRLRPRLKVPVLAHVWDDVDHLTQQRNLDAATRSRTRKRFSRLLQHAQKTAVICEAMQQAYETQHGAKCQIVRHGLSDDVVAQAKPTSSREFRIGFSGGMYAPSAWKTLLEALNLLGWRVNHKRIRFVVMSSHVRFTAQAPANIEFLGWRDTAEVARQLSACDLLYLPQPFETHHDAIAQLSFPTKMSAYANVGRPILVHTPTYGSLSKFYQQYPVGGLCQELKAEKIAAIIRTLAEDEAAYGKAAEAVAQVAMNVLSRSQFEQQVRSFLQQSSAVECSGPQRQFTAHSQELV